MNSIKLFLFIFLFTVSGCSNDVKDNAQNNINEQMLRFEDIADCLKEAEKKYQGDWLVACESSIKTSQQKMETCEKIYLPWKKINIDRSQYCRNISIETAEADTNYRNCMEILDPNIKFSIDQCMGGESVSNIKNCKIADIFLKELEAKKQTSIDECNSVVR